MRSLTPVISDPQAIAVDDLLHHVADARLDQVAIDGLDALELALAHHLAHRALGDGLDGALLRVRHVEEIGRHVHDPPMDREVHVDDVAVGGEHVALFGDIAGRLRGILFALEADIDQLALSMFD